jgi:hypothetical protein
MPKTPIHKIKFHCLAACPGDWTGSPTTAYGLAPLSARQSESLVFRATRKYIAIRRPRASRQLGFVEQPRLGRMARAEPAGSSRCAPRANFVVSSLRVTIPFAPSQSNSPSNLKSSNPLLPSSPRSSLISLSTNPIIQEWLMSPQGRAVPPILPSDKSAQARNIFSFCTR